MGQFSHGSGVRQVDKLKSSIIEVAQKPSQVTTPRNCAYFRFDPCEARRRRARLSARLSESIDAAHDHFAVPDASICHFV